MKAVVTGGGGFLGRAILERLIARGDEVTSLARGAYPELEALGARCLRLDLADKKAVLEATAGADVIFHVAAKAGVWGKRADYESANVTGTENIIAACRAHSIGRLIFTSSPSVCFDGQDHQDASNDLPRATHFLAHYPASKARAEELVLAANEPQLATCALRPHLIFGPHDPHLLPRLIERARAGRLAIVGAGDNEVSLTYIDNAAAAHLAAADRLAPDAAHAGQAYFIAQQEAVRLWDWVEHMLRELDLPPIRRRLSANSARRIGRLCELAWTALRLRGEPPMTRFVAAQLSTSHSYTMEPARRDFGYVEKVGLQEANRRTIEAFR